jgi:hypothetical protein
VFEKSYTTNKILKMYKLIMILFLIFQNAFVNAQVIRDKQILPIEIISELDSIIHSDQKYRLLVAENREVFSQEKIDSLWNLQDVIDFNNTLRVVEIIEEYGYLSSENSNSNFPMHIILMHTPKELKIKVLEIIEKEKARGRIVESSYGIIKWHLKGRKEIKLYFNSSSLTLNNNFMKTKLNRIQLSSVFGGNDFSACSVSCPTGEGEKTYTITCGGSSAQFCEGTDGVGCSSSDGQSKSCKKNTSITPA